MSSLPGLARSGASRGRAPRSTARVVSAAEEGDDVPGVDRRYDAGGRFFEPKSFLKNIATGS
jgi:hypothetical protein